MKTISMDVDARRDRAWRPNTIRVSGRHWAHAQTLTAQEVKLLPEVSVCAGGQELPLGHNLMLTLTAAAISE